MINKGDAKLSRSVEKQTVNSVKIRPRYPKHSIFNEQGL